MPAQNVTDESPNENVNDWNDPATITTVMPASIDDIPDSIDESKFMKCNENFVKKRVVWILLLLICVVLLVLELKYIYRVSIEIVIMLLFYFIFSFIIPNREEKNNRKHHLSTATKTYVRYSSVRTTGPTRHYYHDLQSTVYVMFNCTW